MFDVWNFITAPFIRYAKKEGYGIFLTRRKLHFLTLDETKNKKDEIKASFSRRYFFEKGEKKWSYELKKTNKL